MATDDPTIVTAEPIPAPAPKHRGIYAAAWLYSRVRNLFQSGVTAVLTGIGGAIGLWLTSHLDQLGVWLLASLASWYASIHWPIKWRP